MNNDKNQIMGKMTIEGGDFKKLSVDFKNISIFVGQNGVGKSFVLKSAWFTGYVLQMYKLMSQVMDGEKLQKVMLENINLLVPLTFADHESMSYEWTISDEEETIYSMTVGIENGVATKFEVEEKENFKAEDITAIKYASKETRLMKSYERYDELLETFGIMEFADMENLQKIAKFYKLYDIMMFENVRRVIEEIEQQKQETVERVQKTLDVLIGHGEPFKEGMKITAKGGKAYLNEKPIASLGDGEQALLMMYVFLLN